MRVGEVDAVREWAYLQDMERFWSSAAPLLVGIGWLIAGIASLALYLLRRSEQEYLWFALCGVSWAGYEFIYAAEFGRLVPVNMATVEMLERHVRRRVDCVSPFCLAASRRPTRQVVLLHDCVRFHQLGACPKR